MASTSNNNTPGNYCMQQRAYSLADRYTHYIHSPWGTAFNTALPGLTVNVGKMPYSVLSNNPIETESQLFGINSTNLVNPQKPVAPQPKNLQCVNFIDRNPVFLPEPLVIEKNQRPFPI